MRLGSAESLAFNQDPFVGVPPKLFKIRCKPSLAKGQLMTEDTDDGSISQKEEKNDDDDGSKAGKKKLNTVNEESQKPKSGKMGHESWVRAFLPPEVTSESTSFKCIFCESHLSLKNISRVKQHLLNVKVCKFLLSEQAAQSTVDEIVAGRAALMGRSSETAEGGEDSVTRIGVRGSQPFMDALLGSANGDVMPSAHIGISTERHVSGRKRHKPATVRACCSSPSNAIEGRTETAVPLTVNG